MQIRVILIIISFMFSLTSCMTYDFSRRVSQQGNLLSKTRIDRLKIGMSKENVAILLGNSLMSPTFNNDRWDYAYTWRKGTDPLKICSLSLYFSHDALVKIERHF